MDLTNHILVVLGMMVSLLLEKGWRCYGCLEQEQNALFQIKASFNNHINRTWPPFPSSYFDQQMTTPWEIDSNCCKWEGVECNNITGRVTRLDLRHVRNYLNLGEIHLNASLFLPFEELKKIYLSGNQISGCIESEGFERLSKLSQLELLELNDNNFNNTILSSFKGLSSLKYLYLENNRLQGPFNLKELDSLSNLQLLSLNDNEITKFMASIDDHSLRNLSVLVLNGIATNGRKLQLQSLEALPNLKTLYLEGNNFEGAVFGPELHNLTNVEELFLDGSSLDETSLHSFGALPSLKHLSLVGLSGTLPSQGFLNLKKLEHLDLSYSTIENNFTQTIGMLTSLKTLQLVGCKLSGTLHQVQGLCGLKHLQELRLSNNDLTGILPWCFANLTSLKLLDLSSNQFIGIVSEGFERLSRPSKLEFLDLNFNNFSNTILSSLKGLSALKSLYMANNRLTGPFDLKELDGLNNLEEFDLSYNEINSVITSTDDHSLRNLSTLYLDHIASNGRKLQLPSFQAFPNLQTISLTSNNFEGAIFGPGLQTLTKVEELFLDLSSLDEGSLKSLGALPSLKRLSMTWLNGTLPSQGFPNLKKLELLDLSYSVVKNNFLQTVGMLTSLKMLSLVNCNLSGTLPIVQGLCELKHLKKLRMNTNDLSGALPWCLANLTSLEVLDLSNNRLSGRIPESLATGRSFLYELILSNNKLEGQIFSKNFQLPRLQRLLLDDNQFTGGIPDSLFNSSWLTELDVRNNSLTDRIPLWMSNMPYLQALDLSHNYISNTLPSKFCPSSLIEVYLSNNQLRGSLTDAFYNCFQLQTIDISHNHFTGRIPELIGDFSQLNYLLLGYNNFNGEIPIQLCKLEHVSLIDLSNNNLSGHILPCLRATSVYSTIQESSSSIASAPMSMEQYLEITTKSTSYSYTRRTLILISEINLSSNNFIGDIPPTFGNLSNIQVLNLSHNSLTGLIPSTFSNLKQIESLDLSYNKLNGHIPPELTKLYSLAVFSVAHNNLSGKTPERVAQFATFDKNSYEGNPFLCGLPLPSCNASKRNLTNDSIEEDNSFIHMQIFYVSFIVSYFMVLMGIGVVLLINPYWRQRWLYFVEMRINSCYYFLIDTLLVVSKVIMS